MTINEYFDKVICINLARRQDRWAHVQGECEKWGLTVERFDAHDLGTYGNDGCTASHRGVLELICHHKWERTLILEDDFVGVRDDLVNMFDRIIHKVPSDWEMLYLGAHYAEKPRERINEHVILAGHLKTTSSYAVTYRAARQIAPTIYGIGPIDELMRIPNQTMRCYVVQPRLFAQYNNYSDLQMRQCNNLPCMVDTGHENMV